MGIPKRRVLDATAEMTARSESKKPCTAPVLTLAERRSQIDQDWVAIYNDETGLLPSLKRVLQLYMPRFANQAIADACAGFCLPFLKVCQGCVQIHNTMPPDALIAAMYCNVKARMDNGMVRNDMEMQVRRLRDSLTALVDNINQIYAKSQGGSQNIPAQPENLSVTGKRRANVKHDIVQANVQQSVLKQRSTYTSADARSNALANYGSAGGSLRNSLVNTHALPPAIPPSLFHPLPAVLPPPTAAGAPGVYGQHYTASVSGDFFPNVHPSFPFLSPANIFPPLQAVRGAVAARTIASLPSSIDKADMLRVQSEEQIENAALSDYYARMRHIALSRDQMLAATGGMVDGFFCYNPHSTTAAMDAQRLKSELMMIDHYESVAQNNLQRQRTVWGHHNYENWSDMHDSMKFSSGLFQEPTHDPRFGLYPQP